MYAIVQGTSIVGISGIVTSIEVDISNGLPQIQIVGLPDSAIKEAKERVRSAIKNSGYSFPNKRITINLAPADLKKEGASYDLPLAIGILLADLTITPSILIPPLDKILFIGELSLDGSLQSTQGILASVIAAKNQNFEAIILPLKNLKEAKLISGIKIMGFDNLNEVTNFLRYGHENNQDNDIVPYSEQSFSAKIEDDFIDIKGHQQVKRAITVAVAGHHNLLMVGPPGSGKSMLAKRIPTVLPQLTWEELIEVANIYSVSGQGLQLDQLYNRPFRQPHHSVTLSGLIGGGSIPKPGEISLAHRGVLFLDELTEYPKAVLEALRQPIEDGKVAINRVKTKVEFPAKFLLAAAMNPCPCGYFGANVPNHSCQCSTYEIQRYRAKLSGPMIDRIEIQIEVPWLNIEDLRTKQQTESSKEIREKIFGAIEIQKKRFKNDGIIFNSEMTPNLVKKYCQLEPLAETVLLQSFNLFGFSGRSLDRILKISRTIADLEQINMIQSKHIAEAINYRLLDKKMDTYI